MANTYDGENKTAKDEAISVSHLSKRYSSTEENKARESCQSSSSLELSMDDLSMSVGTSLDSEGKPEKILAKIYYIDAKLTIKVLSTVAKVEKKYGNL